MNILIVLPFSGRKFGGGLAVFNQELTRALKKNGDDVKLVTINLRKGDDDVTPKAKDHGGATIICINDEDKVCQTNPTGIDAERQVLYTMINDSLLFEKHPKLLHKITDSDSWAPDLIIGHSRFFGPAAIQMRDQFPHATVQYFLHSYPIEGTVLVGYDVYNEPIDRESAKEKIAKESEWMQKADVVVPVGPLLRAGALKLLGGRKVRIHECIGGAVATDKFATYNAPNDCLQLIFNGRATAPIKGLEDILLAARTAGEHPRCPKINIKVRYWETRQFFPAPAGKPADCDAVNKFAAGVLGPGSRVTVEVSGKSTDIVEEMRKSHGVLSPSYIEHFGLVAVEALSVHVPVLVNEVSGAGMFLAQASRFGTAGKACVVNDFYTRVSPSRPDEFLDPRNVPRDAFDERPKAWATAITNLASHLEQRFSEAKTLGEELCESYQWTDCAKAIVAATRIKYDDYAITQQGPNGTLWDAECKKIQSQL